MISDAVRAAISFFSLPPELWTAILAAMPVLELRGAIPVGHGLLGLSWFSAFFWSYVGSLAPGALIIWAADPVINWCNRRSKVCNRLIGAALERTRRHFAKKHERFGDLALLVVSAIPLPLAGVWTAALAAVIFGVRFRRAMILIAVGNFVAGLAVTLASAGLFTLAVRYL